jgi:hypothetical protein
MLLSMTIHVSCMQVAEPIVGELHVLRDRIATAEAGRAGAEKRAREAVRAKEEAERRASAAEQGTSAADVALIELAQLVANLRVRLDRVLTALLLSCSAAT